MDEPEDKQPSSIEKLCGSGAGNLAMQVSTGDDECYETEDRILKEELGQLKELIVELKGNLIVLNKGIVARQDTIDQLTKRKLKLLEVDKNQAVTITRRASTLQGLVDPSARDAIEVFPEEIWELILGNLTEPQDLRNCSRSCQMFDKILHPLKQNFLFLEVFPHICPHLVKYLILRCRRVCKGWNEGVDSFVDNHPAHLPRDNDSGDPRCPSPTIQGLFENLNFSNGSGDLRERNFLKEMRHHPRNPFVGRDVTIRVVDQKADDDRSGSDGDNYDGDGSDDTEDDSDNADEWEQDPFLEEDLGAENNSKQDSLAEESDGHDDEDIWDTDSDDDWDGDSPTNVDVSSDLLPPHEALGVPVDQQKKLFWKSVLTFLRTFGKHIWYLSFIYFREGPFIIKEASLFRFLTRRIFSLVPNLRSFEIRGYFPRPDGFIIWPLSVAPKLEKLRIHEHLTSIRVNDSQKGSVSDTLIHASFQQLKELHVDWASWKRISKSNREWGTLTELFINNNGLGGAIKADNLLRSSMPHLRKIGLTHKNASGVELDCDLDFQEIIEIIIGLSATSNLRILQLFGGIEREQVVQAPSHLFAHPNLKTLEIHHSKLRGDYTFLLRFPFLEHLVIFCYKMAFLERSEAQLEKQVVELEPYVSQIWGYECEIWELMPRLKTFTVDGIADFGHGTYRSVYAMYTRECYERIVPRKVFGRPLIIPKC